MNSTEKCQENNYGTSVYIVDEDGNEYDIEEVGTVIFGQFHLYLKQSQKLWSTQRYPLRFSSWSS